MGPSRSSLSYSTRIYKYFNLYILIGCLSSSVFCASVSNSKANNSSEEREHDTELYRGDIDRNFPYPVQPNPFYPGHHMLMSPGPGYLNPYIAPTGSTTVSNLKIDKQGGKKKKKPLARPTDIDLDDKLSSLPEDSKTVKKELEKMPKEIVTKDDNPKSKTEEDDKDDARACPGCVGGSCNTNTALSGIPIIQIILAGGVGIVWAIIFGYLYVNFKKPDKDDSGGGYGYGTPSPSYGAPAPPPSMSYGAPPPSMSYGAPPPSMSYGAPAPSMSYGAPAPSMSYGAPPPSMSYGAPAPSMSYGAPAPPPSQYGPPPSSGYSSSRVGYSRSLGTDSLSNLVWKSIDTLSNLYEDKKGN